MNTSSTRAMRGRKEGMETKHTPGPWVANHDGTVTAKLRNISAEYDPHGAGVAITLWSAPSVGGLMSDEEVLENARLIAAAPELLAALKKLSFAAQTTGETAGRDDGLIAAIDAARAAIAKATGGEL